MPIFELGDESIVPVEQTSFSSTGHRERDDLQRLLRDQIEVVASDVLIIAEEFGEWSDSRRRIDLLGIDKKANLVVIELKRTDDGGHMELQALRYSGMISTLTAKQAIEAYDNYLSNRDIEGDAEQQLLEFLDWSEIDEDSFAQDVRIVLVSANFSRELTTAVIWLNDKDLDIRCVRIRPYEYDGKTLIDVQQVIPLPETADYQIQVREKKRQERASRGSSMDFTRYDITVNDVVHSNQWKRNSILLVVKALLDKEVELPEIRDFFKEMGRGSVFLEVPGEVNDVAVFCNLAEQQHKSAGKKFNANRWHTADDDLLVHDGNTFVFSNRWGSQWPRIMQELKQRYPQIKLEFVPTQS